MSKMNKDEVLKNLIVNDVVDLNHEIGRGSYGVVKQVSLHGTVCAAKVIHEILLSDPTGDNSKPVQDFILELNFSKLRHPNLVQFLGIHYPDKAVTIPWLIMEKLDTSLTQLLGKYKPTDLSLARKISILHDVSLGIQYLHSQEIIHRDLSSNNILLTRHLVAKVADLGVAKVIDPQQVKTHTKVPGTLIFMPPESLDDTLHYGQPIDVFSFGCVTVHVMCHIWPVPERKGTSEIEKRWKYVREVEIISPLMKLITDCLKDVAKERPTIIEVVQTLQHIIAEHSLATYDVIELEKHLASGEGDGSVSIRKEVTTLACHSFKSVKLSTALIKEKSINPSKAFVNEMENIYFPGSPLTKGSHFVFLHKDKMMVHCDLKKYYKPVGRFVMSVDLKKGALDCIDREVRQVCVLKDTFVAMERSPSRIFYIFDPSSGQWKNSSFPPLPQCDIKYPDMLVYSSLLLVISGSCLQVLKLDSEQWFVFKLSIPGGTIEASITTYHVILDDKLFVCIAEKKELYSLDLLEIKDAIFNKSPQLGKNSTVQQVHLTHMLYPVNYILLHKKYLVALHVLPDVSVGQAWYYATCCNHWHNIVYVNPYVDGQWFTMEDGSAAVAELSAGWHVWYNGYYWNIGVKIHQLQLNNYI